MAKFLPRMHVALGKAVETLWWWDDPDLWDLLTFFIFLSLNTLYYYSIMFMRPGAPNREHRFGPMAPDGDVTGPAEQNFNEVLLFVDRTHAVTPPDLITC